MVDQTNDLLGEAPEQAGYVPSERVRAAVTWGAPEKGGNDGKDWPAGTLVVLTCFKQIKQVTWHGKGDYFATVLSEGLNRSVLIHQLSKWRSQVSVFDTSSIAHPILFY